MTECFRSLARMWARALFVLLLIAPAAGWGEVLATQLSHPWALAFLPSGDLLITEKSGSLRCFSEDAGMGAPIGGVPPVYFMSQGGLMDVVLHPDFASDPWVYLTLAHGTAENNATRVVRGLLRGERLIDVEVVHTVSPGKNTPVHYGGRIAFLPDGTFLLTTGDGFNFREAAQDLGSQLGKILRLNDDGTIPKDNPFVGVAGADPAIYSYGHRNPQGLVVSDDGVPYAHEHGPMGGDEINRIEPGANYGWPAATFGRDYTGASVSPFTSLPDVADPLMVWVPSIAPAGMTQLRSARFGAPGDFLVGALVNAEVRRVSLGESAAQSTDQALFAGIGQRIREVREGPNGCIYLLTDGAEGELHRRCSL
ncbi:MAG: PQQ-dependent sugar dehydrogenase [Pseudomonadota bacterium]